MTKLAYIVPCFGEGAYTDRIICDLLSQDTTADVFVVDNKGDLSQDHFDTFYNWGSHKLIHLNGEGRRWLKGTNYGTKIAREFGVRTGEPYDAYVWLNNDTRLSRGFSAGLVAALEALGGLCGLLAPCYADVWPQQCYGYTGEARSYIAPSESNLEHEVMFVDGACMVVPAHTWDHVGEMDERFWQFGWGGDLDYALRVRQQGLGVYVTERAYFEHLGGGTNKLLEENYHGAAGSEMHTGMLEKYGPGWDAMLVGNEA